MLSGVRQSRALGRPAIVAGLGVGRDVVNGTDRNSCSHRIACAGSDYAHSCIDCPHGQPIGLHPAPQERCRDSRIDVRGDVDAALSGTVRGDKSRPQSPDVAPLHQLLFSPTSHSRLGVYVIAVAGARVGLTGRMAETGKS